MYPITDNLHEGSSIVSKSSHVIFDLDDTLTSDLKPISDGISFALTFLHKHGKKIYILTGTNVDEVIRMVSHRITVPHVMAGNTGTHVVEVSYNDGDLVCVDKVYEVIEKEDKDKIIEVINMTIDRFSLTRVEDQIIDKGSQITLSCIGRYADRESKKYFDPEGNVRTKMVNYMKQHLSPTYHISIGGTTSIDITVGKKDKAYGVKKLNDLYNFDNSVVFIGDGFGHKTNDMAAAKEAPCIYVKNPLYTKFMLFRWYHEYVLK